jgi:hypothetical protein
MKYSCLLIKMLATQNTGNTAKNIEQRGSHTSLVGMQNGIATLEDSLMVSHKIKHILTLDPAIKTLGFHTHIQTCTQVYTAVLPSIAQTWKQPRCH